MAMALDELLAGAAPPAGLTAAEARALVDALVERRDTARLQALAGEGPALLTKEARRGLHRLRTRGIEAPAPGRTRGTPITALGEAPEAWAAVPDGHGDRLFTVLRPSPSGRWDLVHFRVSDELGLVEVAHAHGPKRLWRELQRTFVERGLACAPIAVDLAAWWIDEGYRRTLELGRSPPQGFAAARPIVGAVPAVAPFAGEHPGLVVPAATLDAREAARLHDLPDLHSWSPPEDVLRTLGRELEEVDASQLVIDDAQRQRARRDAVERAISASFAGAAGARWRRRLLDAAHVYAASERRVDAGRLRAQADRVTAADFDPTTDPFARALVEKLVAPELLAAPAPALITP